MDFISIEFAVFFSCVVWVYFFLPRNFRAAWLLLGSIFFYAAFQTWFIGNLIAASLVAYVGARFIEDAVHKEKKKLIFFVVLSILIANFMTLRYLPHFGDLLQYLLHLVDIEVRFSTKMGVPIGLSFYTFLLIGYLVDILKGTKAERNFGNFFLFVSFFPKIIAGPIERTNNFLPQIRNMPAFDYALAVFGLQLILLGVFKKVFVADRLAPLVQSVYENPYAADGPMLTAATLIYAFQLYFDFSGYTDIAIGCAAILGFRLIGNFRQPYFATSISDFWKRWHISLTSWLTDYVYNPIVRQRRLKFKLYYTILIAIFSTFLISGIWHGAQWTFVLWGILHGGFIIFSILTQKLRIAFVRQCGLSNHASLHKFIKILTTFLLVSFAYIFFRAHNVSDAIHIMSHLWNGWNDPISSLNRFVGGAKLSLIIGLSGILVVMIGEFLQEKGRPVYDWLYRWPQFMRWGTYALTALMIVVIGSGNESQTFIYFRF